ncbi:aldose epimerase family protein [uncultured Dubosiella sp.]|uniref:aldose epimerase family protein n=2 Tax=uncultured Dubosiella sp. TaxID=1937011 RepID=UPI0025EE9163|nr:aldose epimerase family protein [uncultured Dubosiella sp.]
MEQEFGINQRGDPATLFILQNERFIMAVTDYGATLVSWIDRKKNIDIVAGFDKVEDYIDHVAHFGSMIGRVANRIRNATFTLNGTKYYVSANKGANSLHGGWNGFDKLMFHGEENGSEVVFTARSPDGDEGYPGNLDIRITYTLDEEGIHIKSEGITDHATLFGVTNHSYFNLNGCGTIKDHEVTIFADAYAPNDESGTAVGTLIECQNTPFDFRQPKAIGTDFACGDEQISMNGGYDHHYAVSGSGLRDMAVCKANGLKLVTRSNLPGIHFYTGNFLNGAYTGHNGISYGRHERVCFEPEYYPNAINYEGFAQPILLAGEKSVQIIEYLLCDED